MNEEKPLDLLNRWKQLQESDATVTFEEFCASCSGQSEPSSSDLARNAAVQPNLSLGATRTYDSSTELNFLHSKNSDSELPHSGDFQVISSPSEQPNVHAFRVGQVIAGFRLLRVIGEGGFGQVFEAEDTKLNRLVAIKFLIRRAITRPDVDEQFLAEARSMAAIHHDHVVPIYQVGQVESNLFLVMPLLVGETLAQRIKREGSLSPVDVRRIGYELGLGIAALHAKGLLHRDIKPANIWLDINSGRVKLLDLGLANDASKLTTGVSAGTPAYMSPEQVEARELDFRSDLFSLGSVLFECLTGRRAFAGQNVAEIFRSVVHSKPLSVGDINPGVPSELSDLVAALLSKDPANRPQSALEVAAVLQSVDFCQGRVEPKQDFRQLWWAKNTIWAAIAVITLLTVSLVGRWFVAPPDSQTGVGTENVLETSVSLEIESLDIIPWRVDGDRLVEALPILGARGYKLPTTENAIEVTAKLSRPAYCYIVLYRSDGKDVLLFPQEENESPPLTDRPCYPSTRLDVRYVLDDGPGIWAVAVICSEAALPSYREWRQLYADQQWGPQTDPSLLNFAILDTGRQQKVFGGDGGISRGERNFALSPFQKQMDWLKRQVPNGSVAGLTFPVR